MTSTKQPPLAKGFPIIGSLFPMLKDNQRFVIEQYQKLGSIFRIKVLNNSMTVIGGKDAVALLNLNDGKVNAHDVWKPVVADFGGRQTMTMVDGEEHRRYKRVFRQSFSRQQITNNVALIGNIVQRMARELPVNKPLTVVTVMRRLIAAEIGTITLGREPGENFDDIVKWWHTLLNVHIATAAPESQLHTPEYLEARGRVEALAREIIEERRSGKIQEGESNFADDLVAAMESDPDLMNFQEVLFHVLTPYFAGMDTVADTTSVLLFYILTMPELYARVMAEVDEVFGNGIPAPEELRRLDVLHAASMEVLRLHPPAGVFPRYAAEDFEFNGYHVPKGERLLMAVAADHYNPDYFTNPWRFDVDRFREPRNEHKQKGVYAPYGAGAHTCLGSSMADIQIPVTVAFLLRELRLTIDPPGTQLGRVGPSLSKPWDFKMKVLGRREERERERLVPA